MLRTRFAGVYDGVHVLPFFTPLDGADAGFDPIDHTKVDPRLGSWDDVAELSKSHDIIVDAIVNHMSWESAQFQDVLKNGEKSEYYPMFLTMSSVFPNGATEEDLAGIYRPRGESRKFRTPKSFTRRGRHIGRATSSCNMRTLR